MKTNYKEKGVELKKRRLRLGLKQKEIAKTAKLAEATICRIETGIKTKDAWFKYEIALEELEGEK